jgi:hypothetical protein
LQMNSLYLLLAAFGLNQFINQRRPFNIVCDLRYTILKFCSHWVTAHDIPKTVGNISAVTHLLQRQTRSLVIWIRKCTSVQCISISSTFLIEKAFLRENLYFHYLPTHFKKTKLNLSNFTFKYKNKF